MSLRAVVEIVIHLESFRNIDLFFQGIYYTGFRIYSKKTRELGRTTPSGTPSQQATAENRTPASASAAGDRGAGSASQLGPSGDQIEFAQPYCSYVSHYQQ